MPLLMLKLMSSFCFNSLFNCNLYVFNDKRNRTLHVSLIYFKSNCMVTNLRILNHKLIFNNIGH